MSTEVKARTAQVTVRTVTLTKALLKQCRTFTDTPKEPFCRTTESGTEVLPEFAVGWFRGSVLGDEDHDFVLFARDGDLLLGRFWRSISRWRLPKECKQLYI